MSLANDTIGKSLLRGLIEALESKGNISIEDISGIFEQVAGSVKAGDAKVDAFVRSEITKLARYISEAKSEILAITPNGEENACTEFFNIAGEELNEVVQATEEATNKIMDSTDAILQILRDAKAPPQLNEKLTKHANNIFDACTFQDITGQRINKVIKTLNYVEVKIAKIARLFGNDDANIAEIATKDEAAIIHDARSDAHLMGGPQLAGKAISQDDIDALFD